MDVKHSVDELATFGGSPLFATVKPIGQLSKPDQSTFFGYMESLYKTKRCSNNGPMLHELERRLAVLHQVEYCVAFANASMALIATMKTLAPQPGEVIIPSFTYVGLPHLVQWAGHKPKFCDISSQTHTFDLDAVAHTISNLTSLILAVHQVNAPCEIYPLEELASAFGVPLLFDSVHGFGCTYDQRPIGGFGYAEVFSLHATKILNGFEGGYVTTNDVLLAAELRVVRNFGFTGRDFVVCLGLNAKLNEIHAAMALASLDRMDEIIRDNKRRYKAYEMQFFNIEGLHLKLYGETERFNYEFCLLEVDDSWRMTRDQIIRLLRDENALARAYYSPPTHLSSHCPRDMTPPSLPVTEYLAGRFIQMPVGEFVDEDDIRDLASLFRFMRANQQNIIERLSLEQ